MSRFFFILFALLSFCSSDVFANDGLIIHGAEIGIGKFHRADNLAHPYGPDNIWINYVLPEKAGTKTPMIQENRDGSITIFFSHLEELLTTAIETAKEKQKKIQVFNISAHGLPGAMWFPADDAAMNSAACRDWVNTAHGDDKANYDQYYSPVGKADILTLRILSYIPLFSAPCTSGAREWKRVVAKLPAIKGIFAAGAQLHFFSCVVGYGSAGKKLVKSIGPLLFNSENAKVQAAMNFGLGDWSMPEGMGFWDYQNSKQLHDDNARYPVDRKDRDVMQKGEIRLAQRLNGKWQTGILGNLDFMYGNLDSYTLENAKYLVEEETQSSRAELLSAIRFPLRARIPGTATVVEVW